MNLFLDMLNNREKALAIWLLIFIAWALFRRDVRNSFLNFLKVLFEIKIVVMLASVIIYVGLAVLALYTIGFWKITLIKDTVLWFLGTAVVLFVNVNKASRDERYFRSILLDNLKFTAVLEFVVNLYAFDLWIELILVPALFLVVAMYTVAGTKKEYAIVKKIFGFVLSMYGLFLIAVTFVDIFNNPQGLATPDNLRVFTLPILLTLMYIPFLYFWALLMAYEVLFVRVDILVRDDKATAKFAKRQIFALCGLNLLRLNRFAKESNPELMNLKDKKDVTLMINKFRTKPAAKQELESPHN